MKKYNVLNLCVVESQGKYFICEASKNELKYVEVLTKTVFKVNNEIKVQRLKDYYSPLAVINFTTKEPLLLSEKDILDKYLEINNNFEKECVALKKAPEEGYEITSEEKEILKSLRKLKKQGKTRMEDANKIDDITIGLTKEDHERIYQDVVVSIIEPKEKVKRGKKGIK